MQATLTSRSPILLTKESAIRRLWRRVLFLYERRLSITLAVAMAVALLFTGGSDDESHDVIALVNVQHSGGATSVEVPARLSPRRLTEVSRSGEPPS